MRDALEVQRQLADLYTAIAHMRERSLAERITEAPCDPRLRTTIGRKEVMAELHANALEEGIVLPDGEMISENKNRGPKQAGRPSSSGNETLQLAVLERFAALFAVEV